MAFIKNIQHIRKFISPYWKRSLSVGNAWLCVAFVIFGEQGVCLLQHLGSGFYSQDHHMLQDDSWSPSHLIYVECCRTEGSQAGKTKGMHFSS